MPVSGHNLAIEFDVRFANGNGYFLFLVDGDSQFGGQAHLLRFAVTPKRVELMQDRGDPGSKLAQKKKRDANGGKRIAPTKLQLDDPSFYRIESLARQAANGLDGSWHHVQIVLDGNNVIARFDNGPELTVTGTVLDVSKSRVVFLVGKNGDISLDRVTVTNRD